MDEFRLRVLDNKFHIIAVTESWATNTITDAELNIAGYSMIRKDRCRDISSKGGGVILYVKDSLIHKPVESLNSHLYEESVWCQVEIKGGELLIGVCYRSTASDQANNDQLLHLLEEATTLAGKSHVLIMGDFNYPEINFGAFEVHGPYNSEAARFFDATQDLFLHQHVQDYTRFRMGQNPSLLDYIFTDEENQIDNLTYQAPVGKSDHCCLQFDYIVQMTEVIFSGNKLNYQKGDYAEIIKDLGNIDWDNSLEGKDTEDMWKVIKDAIIDLSKKHIPIKNDKHTGSKRKDKWIKRRTIKEIKKREAAWKDYRKFNNDTKYREYKEIRNTVTTMIRQDKRDYQHKLVTSFKDSQKRFYGYVRSKQTVKTTVSRLTKQDGSRTTSDDETAEVLGKQFQSVFVREKDIDIKIDTSTETIPVDFDEATVYKKLISLKTDKAPGPDGIHPLFLCRTASVLAKPLAALFTKSYQDGKMPLDWKLAVISPIFKKGKKDSAENYRPISLTSVLCKLMESIIRDRITEHLDTNDIVTSNQHGFTHGRSCLTNLLETLESWTELLEEGYGLDVIYLDYRKAFDTVPHRRLINKLNSIGITGKLLVWLEDFLFARKMRVQVNGSLSDWLEVLSGVPQGSVLGPLLFLLYVNDLPDWIKAEIIMFADDTKLWTRICNTDDSSILQTDLNNLKEWSDKWLLLFNPEKCKIMHIGHKLNTKYFIEQENQKWELEAVQEEKDLGIIMTKDLKVSKQCNEAARKAMNVLRLIKRHFFKPDIATFRILYKSFIRPHLEYSIQAWSPYLRKDIDVLEKVQRRATKLVNGLKHVPYEERLKRIGLTTLEKRRVRGDLIETYKILTGKENVDSSKFFILNHGSHNLRGHRLKLYKSRSRLNIRKFFYSQRVVDVWNSLPDNVVEADTTNCFKKRLDNEWGI